MFRRHEDRPSNTTADETVETNRRRQKRKKMEENAEHVDSSILQKILSHLQSPMNTLDQFKASQSESFKKRNPHLFGSDQQAAAMLNAPSLVSVPGIGGGLIELKPKTKKKRIRQSEKPLMNKLESEFFEHIRHEFPNFPRPKPQAVKLKIAGSAFYKPDFFVTLWPQDCGPAVPTAWEVKGLKGKNIDRGKLALKCAASNWPDIKFILVWKEDGVWHEQVVLP